MCCRIIAEYWVERKKWRKCVSEIERNGMKIISTRMKLWNVHCIIMCLKLTHPTQPCPANAPYFIVFFSGSILFIHIYFSWNHFLSDLYFIFLFFLFISTWFSLYNHTAVMVIDWYRLADGTLFAPFRMFSLVCDLIIICDVMWWFLVWFPVCDIIKKCVNELGLFAMALAWWCRAHWWVSSLIWNKEKTT